MYVFKFQVVKNIIVNLECYGVMLFEILNYLYFVIVMILCDIDVMLVVKLVNLLMDEFKVFNLLFNWLVILGVFNLQILLLYDNVEMFQYNLNMYYGGFLSWMVVMVGNCECVEVLVVWLKVDFDIICEINCILKGMCLKVGFIVVVLCVDGVQENVFDISFELVENVIMVVEFDMLDFRKVVVCVGKCDMIVGLL